MTNGQRDAAVLDLTLSGKSRTEIALAVALSTGAVERVLARLRRRHFVTTTAQLIAKVLREQRDQARAERDDCLARHGEIDRRRPRGG